MDLNRYYTNLIRRWLWLLVLAPLVAGAATYYVIDQQPTVYTASSRLLFGPGTDSPNPDLNELRTGGQLMHTYAEVATTGPFLQSVIDRLGFTINPKPLSNKVTLIPDDTSRVLTISVEDSKSPRAVAIANAYANALVDMSPANPGGSGTQIREQMRAQAVQLESDIAAMKTTIGELTAKIEAVTPTNNMGGDALVTAPEAMASGDSSDAASEIAARIEQLETEIQNTKDVPRQRLILDRIGLERDRLKEMQNNDTQALRLILDQLSQERTRLADAQRTLALLYSSMNATSTNQVQLLDSASVAGRVSPQLQLKMLMGAMAGLILALTITLAADYFNDTLRTVDELEQVIGRPVLGAISKHNTLFAKHPEGLVVRALSASRTAEDYRLLGAKLLLSRHKGSANHSVLVSSVPGEDNTSEIAANMAVIMAQMGVRVVLVDANLRRPVIAQLFGILNHDGLAGWLRKPSEEPELMAVDWVPGLAILPGNSAECFAFELLASPRMADLVKELKARADVLIIAGSPLLSCAESLILASHVDEVLLVARSGVIRRKVINYALEHLRLLGVRAVGVVLNDSRRAHVHVPHPVISHPQTLGRPDYLSGTMRRFGKRLVGMAVEINRKVGASVVSSATIASVPPANAQRIDDSALPGKS